MAKAKDKPGYPNPDDIHSELLKQAEEQEEREAQIAELEATKKTLKDNKLPIPAELEATIEEFKSSSPKKLIPDWVRNAEWIEHLETKQGALQKALDALSETKGADIERIKTSLSESLAKVKKVLSAPKEELHGLSHADYARRVNKVVTNADVEKEGSEENIYAQITELQEDLSKYEEGFDSGNIAYLHARKKELLAHKKRLEKVLQRYKGESNDEFATNIKRLINQIDRNLKDLQNKDIVKGEPSRQRNQIIIPKLQDPFNEYQMLRQTIQHMGILNSSAVEVDEDSQEKAREVEIQLEPKAQEIIEKLKDLISKKLEYKEANTQTDYWNQISQQTFLNEFKEWTMEAIQRLEAELNEESQAEELTLEEILEVREKLHPNTNIVKRSVEQIVAAYPISNLSELKTDLARSINDSNEYIEDYQSELTSLQEDLKKLKKLKADAKGFGKRHEKKLLTAFQQRIYNNYKGTRYCFEVAEENSVKRQKGKVDNEGILAIGIQGFTKLIEEASQRKALKEKFLEAIKAEENKKLLERLNFLKEKLEKGDKS